MKNILLLESDQHNISATDSIRRMEGGDSVTAQVKEAIGERIRECRKRIHLSQEQLAEAIQVAPNTISNIETGNSMASLENIIKLTEVFHVSLDYLVTGRQVMDSFEDDPYIDRYKQLPNDDKAKIQTILNLFYPIIG